MLNRLIFILSACALTSCQRQEQTINMDDLNAIKKEFLFAMATREIEESPFHMNYSLRTVFFSPDIVSLFGEMMVYDHLPHGWWRYEGKTLCKTQGILKEVALEDLFPQISQKEWLRQYCENALKAESMSYFADKDPLCTRLNYEDLSAFVIDNQSLILLFQPYTVGGLGDGPWHVKIPYQLLRDHWSVSHPLVQLLNKTLSAQSYTASWNADWIFQEEKDSPCAAHLSDPE